MAEEGYRVARAGKNHPVNPDVYRFEELPGFPVNCVSREASYDTSGIREFIARDDPRPFLLFVCSLHPHAPWTWGDPSEFDPDCANPVIATMEEQKDIVAGKGDMGHTMRLGSYPAELEEGSIVAELYGTTHVTERHRHRYEVNVAYKDRLREGGLVISGQSPDGELTEFVELPREVHPFYVATQAHPEFKSRPTKPHPLFAGLVKAALDHQQAR